MIPANVGDEDIKKEVLNIENILYTSWFEIISFIESKEVGRHATQNFRKVSAVSLSVLEKNRIRIILNTFKLFKSQYDTRQLKKVKIVFKAQADSG